MKGWLLPGVLILVALGAFAALVAGDRTAGLFADRAWIALVGLAAALLLVAALLARNRSRGSEPAILVARDGALRRGAGVEGAGPSGRRSVPVIVLGGQAAIVERLGRLNRVLFPGRHTLAPGEVIARVVNTTTRTLAGSLDAATRDGVPVSVEFQMEAGVLAEAAPASPRAELAGRALSAQSLPAQAEEPSQEAVVQAAYRQPNWELAALNAARNALRDSLAGIYLGEIYDLGGLGRDSNPFAALADQARASLDEETRAWGVTVRRIRIGRVKLPPEVVKTAVEAWQHRREAALAEAPAALPIATGASAPGRGSAETSGKMRLFPIIGRGQAASLREALRQRLGYVVTTLVDVDGRAHGLHPIGEGPASELSLRPDAILFAVQVGSGGVVGTHALPGDYLLFEQNEALLDGRVIALVADGQVAVGSVSRRHGHHVVQTDAGGEAPLALVENQEDLEAASLLYAGEHLDVRLKPAREVRVLGHAVMVLRATGAGAAAQTPPPPVPSSQLEPAVDEMLTTSEPEIESSSETPEQGGSWNE